MATEAFRSKLPSGVENGEEILQIPLTGLDTNSDNPVTEEDTILGALGKLQGQVDTLAAEDSLPSGGTTSDYLRGDGSWQVLNKSTVGLSNVDNTSDANKPISTAVQGALDGKQTTLAIPSQAEAEAGTATIARAWTAQRVLQAITA
jgi:hypothetical protein